MRLLSIACAIAVGCALTSMVQAQKLYRWVDENGNVYYSDKVPPEHNDQQRDQLNRHGMVVDTVERALTPEELAAKKAAAAQAEQEAEARAEQLRQDQLLLSSYAGEDDIYRVRDQKIEAINRTMQVTQATISSQERSLGDMIKRAGDLERAGQQVSPALRSSIEEMQRQIGMQEGILRQKEAEIAQINEEADRDAAQYRAAMERVENSRTREPATAQNTPSPQ